MKRFLFLTAIALLAATLPAGAAEPHHTFTPKTSTTFVGSTAPGTNLDYHENLSGLYGPGQCNGVSDPRFTCEEFFIKTDAQLNFEDEDPTNNRYKTILLATLTPEVPGVDYDLQLWDADENGNVTGSEALVTSGRAWFPEEFGELLGPVEDIDYSMNITTPEKNVDYFVLRVIFYAAAGGYDLDVSW